jgi:predicted ArsR family transcriptional regulator
MLERLLSQVSQGGVHSYADLARQLAVSEELLEQMLQDLARMGYLRPVADGCGIHCAGCPQTKDCATGGPARVWALTGKSRQHDVTSLDEKVPSRTRHQDLPEIATTYEPTPQRYPRRHWCVDS